MYYLDLLVIGLVWGCTYAMMALGLTLLSGWNYLRASASLLRAQ